MLPYFKFDSRLQPWPAGCASGSRASGFRQVQKCTLWSGQVLPSGDTTFSFATCLRLGARCGDIVVNVLKQSTASVTMAFPVGGVLARHASINDLIRRALAISRVPPISKPNGMARDDADGIKPDSMTIMPWNLGRPLVWDATYVDTLAPSHLPSSACCAGAIAAAAALNWNCHPTWQCCQPSGHFSC